MSELEILYLIIGLLLGGWIHGATVKFAILLLTTKRKVDSDTIQATRSKFKERIEEAMEASKNDKK